MAKYFSAHYGVLDNLGWMASKGFNEAGLVVPDGQLPSPASIHNAGIPIATLNIFNDGSSPASQIGAGGGQYAGYYQSIAKAGWNMIAGEGCGGDVIATVMNYLPYCNYGGDQANNMYAPPWNHGNTGKGHVDYIEIYGRNTCTFDYGGVMGCIQAAKNAGAKHLGILIGDWCLDDANKYINIVDSQGCDTICFWGGYGQPSSRMQGLADQLIRHYGTAKWGGGATPSTAAKPGAAGVAAKRPVIHCPCRHIWIGFAGSKDFYNFSEKLEFWVKLTGRAGWVDDNAQWIPGTAWTGLLSLWAQSESRGAWWVQNFWPDKNGAFQLWLASDTPEKRTYRVGFPNIPGPAPWRTVME